MKKTAVLIIFLCLFLAKPGITKDKNTPSVEITGKTSTFASLTSLSGPGSNVKNLATTYDMSLFEFGWGGKQTLFNGSGITTNTSYPLADGEAFTNSTQIGLSQNVSEDLKAGFLIELYSLLGDRAEGRVFGDKLPWGDFPREDGLIQAPHFAADFYHGYLEGKHGHFNFRLVAGTLTSKDLPELSRKEMNQVKLGSLVYRVPVTNSSYFEKEERKLEEGRHPARGFDFIGEYEYADKKHIHFEIFSGATEPTPVSDIERDAYGGRVSTDIGAANTGLTYVYNNGLRPASGIKENQGVWSLDCSYKLLNWLIPYFTFAQTDYERSVIHESHKGDAYVAGALIKYENNGELKIQYQKLEENYDLMAYHKIEHYPSNFEGLNILTTIPVTEKINLKNTFYYLDQIDTVTQTHDTLFGDSFFSSLAGSDPGSIGAERFGADWKYSEKILLNGYIEHAKFRKNTLLISSSIDKDVYNFYAGASYNFTKRLYADVSFRHFFSVGNWQVMNFRSYQDIPEAAVGYKLDKDKYAVLIYQYYNFQDNNGASGSNNDYQGHQAVFVIRANF